MKNKKKFKVTTEARKTTTKEKIIGVVGWCIAIGLLVYIIVR